MLKKINLLIIFSIVLLNILFFTKIYFKIFLLKFTKLFIITRFDKKNILAAYEINVCDASISVIFPTKNGLTNGVAKLIESLKNQSIQPLEIIAVDSGSSDGTQDYLRSIGVKVIDNSMNEFHHSKSRNIGAEHANGNFLLFTVDDAKFIDNTWIERALKLLIFSNSDSISGIQKTERINDFYSVFKTQSQFAKSLRDYFDFCILKLPPFLIILYKFLDIKNPIAPIDDTNHLVKALSFERLKFRTNTVEDLDFGSRLLDSGGKVFFTRYLHIIHGHEYTEDNVISYSNRIAIDQRIFRDVFEYGPFNFYTIPQMYHAFNTIISVFERFKRLSGRTIFKSDLGLYEYILILNNFNSNSKFIIDDLKADTFLDQIFGQQFIINGKVYLNIYDNFIVKLIVNKFYISLKHAFISGAGFNAAPGLSGKKYNASDFNQPPDVNQFINMYKFFAVNYIVTLASFSNNSKYTKLRSLTLNDWR